MFGSINNKERNIIRRLEALEEKVFKKTKRKPLVLAQKVILLKYIGLIDNVNSLNLTQTNRALLLSTLLDTNSDNVEKALNKLSDKDADLFSIRNLEEVMFLLDELKMESQYKEVHKLYLKALQKQKNEK